MLTFIGNVWLGLVFVLIVIGYGWTLYAHGWGELAVLQS